MSKILKNKSKSCKDNPIVLLYEVHSPLTDVNYYEDISGVLTKK